MANKANELTTTDIIFVALSVFVGLILENINRDNLCMQMHICTTQISSSVCLMKVDGMFSKAQPAGEVGLSPLAAARGHPVDRAGAGDLCLLSQLFMHFMLDTAIYAVGNESPLGCINHCYC